MNKLPLLYKLTKERLLFLSGYYARLPGTCLLFSGGDFATSGKSYLWLFPVEVISISSKSRAWEGIENALGPFSKEGGSYPKWVGYFSYELGAQSDPDCKIDVPNSSMPLAYFQRCAIVLEVDHGNDEAVIYYENTLEDEAEKVFEEIRSQEVFNKSLPDPLIEEELEMRPLTSKERYLEQIEQIQKLIVEGDVYQINLSHEIQFLGKRDPFSVFQKTSSINPSSFSAYMQLGDFSLVSTSPERFLLKKDNYLETRPIKGTIVRGKTPKEDEENRYFLLTDDKEKAELLMITDLSRNDLGKVSKVGSVSVDEMFSLQSYTNVFHMHSTISSEALPMSPVALLRSLFPGGSITGCPKLRSQQIIADLERRPRGVYTGSIGYFTNRGDFDFNIAIRTLMFTRDCISLQVGGAIVADSCPEREYKETLHKGASLFQVLQGVCQEV